MENDNRSNLPWSSSSWDEAAVIASRRLYPTAAVIGMSGAMTADTPIVMRARPDPITQLLLQTVIAPDQGADRGKLIIAVLYPWFDIIETLKNDPSTAFQIPWEKWEEIIAGSYSRRGFEKVILTPRSGDYGRDVIAWKKSGTGVVRVIDQVKAFTPGNLVTANDVRALVGVVHMDNAWKGYLTTTSDFAPMIKKDPLIEKVLSSELIELINGTRLLGELKELGRTELDGD
jgi:restriction system protein